MLKLGEKIISDIYLGDKKIAKVFLGDKLVYQADKPIFLDYISFDGDSWVDVDYIPSSNTRVVGKVSFTQWHPTAGANYVFGVFGGGANFGFNVGSNRGILNVPWGTNSGVPFSNANTFGQVYSFDISKNGVYLDGVLKIATSQLSQEFTATKSFFVGWANGTGTQKLIGNVYPMQMYENEVLVKDIRPCLDPNGTVCLYDMVTKKYHYNIGTGTLKAGGRFVESIVFDGASWIDTGIAQQTYTIECTVKLENTGYRQFLGGWNHIGGYYIAVDTSNRFELGSSAIVTNSNATELSNVVAEHTETEMILTVNGNYAKRTKQAQNEPNKNYWLGDLNSTSYSAPIKGQVRGHKFKNVDGVLIQDLRPYVDGDGVACFKDIVTGDLFYNKGTGTLGYTE